MNNEEMAKYYTNLIQKYGESPQGVDWGEKCTEYELDMRYQNMLNVISYADRYKDDKQKEYSLLDVGCGFCGLKSYAEKNGIPIHYTGIDLYNVEEKDYVILDDFLEHDFTNKFDFVVCNGILTCRFDMTIRDFEKKMMCFISKMFETANIGTAFNVMKSQVDFMKEELYYKSPLELLGFCMTLTDKLMLDCAYPLYEYTMYLYK